MATNQFVARNGIISLSDDQVTGSLYVSGTVSANLALSPQANFVAYNTATGLFSYEGLVLI